MAKDTNKKNYKGNLLPNSRKTELLKDTLDHLQNGSKTFFHAIISLYGAVTPETISNYIKHSKLKLDTDLICATLWFRVVEKSQAGDCEILQPLIPKKLKEYLGEDYSEYVGEYITSSFNSEKHVWVDCRKMSQEFSKTIKTSHEELSRDVHTMIMLKYLPINTNYNSYDTTSKIFGSGEKEDCNAKVNILKNILEALEKRKEANDSILLTREEQHDIILKAGNATNAKEFSKNYKGESSGSSNFLDKALKNNTPLINAEIQKFSDRVVDAIKSKSLPNELYIKKYFKEYLNSKLGNYHLGSWSEMLKNAMSDIQSKNTRNYNFAIEKFNLSKELEKYSEQDAKMLNEYFSSSYFNSQDEFVITSSHVGGKNLKDLFALWESIEDPEEAIDAYIENIKNSLDRPPIRPILQYIYELKTKHGITEKQILSATSYNYALHKKQRQKIHPTVKGFASFTYGGSALSGQLIPANKNEKFKSLDCRIWIHIELYHKDKAKWEKHHIPFYNIRLFEEVYAEGNSDKVCTIRNNRFGYNFNHPLTEDQKECIKSAPPHKQKVIKRLMRVQAALNAGDLPKISLKNTSLTLNRKDDKFIVTVIYKFEKAQKPNGIQVGDKLFAFDQNQTASHSWCILEVTEKSDPEAIQYKNSYLKVEKTGDFSSVTSGFDQLSYEGLQHHQFPEWRAISEEFVNKWRHNVVFNKRKKTEEYVDYLEQFERLKNKKYSLYKFNCEYARLILKIMRDNPTDNIKLMREELIRFLTGDRSILRRSSLNHHSFDAIRFCKSIINSYFNRLIPGKDITDEIKQQFDPEMFEIRKSIESKRNNKAKEKTNRLANFAIKNNCKWIVGEGGLPTGDKSKKKQQNSKNLDWLARALVSKIQQLAPMHDKSIECIDAMYTSHQDPFVHQNPDSCMRARFDYIPTKEICEWHMKKISNYLKNFKAKTTNVYYHDAIKNFIAHYNLGDLETDLKNNKVKFWDLQERLKNFDDVLMPKAGGRYYLATHKIVDNSNLVEFNNKKFWLSNSDQIAAINIGLSGISKVQKKSKAHVT